MPTKTTTALPRTDMTAEEYIRRRMANIAVLQARLASKIAALSDDGSWPESADLAHIEQRLAEAVGVTCGADWSLTDEEQERYAV